MKEQKNLYYYLYECNNLFSHSKKLLQQLRSLHNLDNILHFAAFQYSLIEYTAPFTISNGPRINPNTTKRRHYQLDKAKYIEPQYHQLHDRIITTRNSFLARNDLTPKKAIIDTITTEGMTGITIVETHITGSEEIKNINHIIDMKIILQTMLNTEPSRIRNNLAFCDTKTSNHSND
jgi:hypothetical protein